MGVGAGARRGGAYRAAGCGGAADAAGGLRRAASRRALERAFAVLGAGWRTCPGGGGQPVSRRGAGGGLPVAAVAASAADAAGEPADRGRRGLGQNRRSRADSGRTAVAAADSAGAGARAGVAAHPMAGRTAGQVRAALRGGGSRRHRAAAPAARHGRQPVALLQPHRRFLPLPAPAGCARAVSCRVSRPGRFAASALGSADRRRVPQPDAVAHRPRQRALPDAPRRGAAVRAPPVPFRHAPQRPHALLHRPPGDARSRALHPHHRDDGGDARAAAPCGGAAPEAGDRRRCRHAAVLPPASTASRRLGRKPVGDRIGGRLRRVSPAPAGPGAEALEAGANGRRFRGGDSGQALALLPRRVRGILAARKAGLGRGRRCFGAGVRGGRTQLEARARRRSRNRAARRHRRHGRRRVAEEPRR